MATARTRGSRIPESTSVRNQRRAGPVLLGAGALHPRWWESRCQLSGLLAGLLLVLSPACQRQPDGWTPVADPASIRSLETETDRALESLEEARSVFIEDPTSARHHLNATRRALLRIRDFYLPLLKARQSISDAARRYRLGDREGVLADLAAIESALLNMVRQGHPRLSQELDPVIESVAKAEAAVTADRGDAPELLADLESRIQMLDLKGDLALHGSELGER